jgi:hypothetical protein
MAQIVGIIEPNNVVGSGTGAVPRRFSPLESTNCRCSSSQSRKWGDPVPRSRDWVLAAGNGIGTRADITAVKGTLVCDTNGSAGGGNSTLVQTPAVPLSLDGDAHFSGALVHCQQFAVVNQT